MSPIELLQKHSNELQRNLDKSYEMFEAGKITEEVHKTHLHNLFRLINQFDNAIKKLLE